RPVLAVVARPAAGCCVLGLLGAACLVGNARRAATGHPGGKWFSYQLPALQRVLRPGLTAASRCGLAALVSQPVAADPDRQQHATTGTGAPGDQQPDVTGPRRGL